MFLLRIATKLHCRHFVYRILSIFINSNGYDIFPDVTKANDFLQSISPDNGQSCLCNNYVLYPAEYDLQIVVPVYNVEHYVRECIESILLQKTKYSFCVIIINDGSKDNSREIIKQYESTPNVFIIDQENQGLSGARNTGIKQIRSKYVMFVDSDDSLYPDCVDLLMSKALRGNYDIVEGGYDFYREKKILLEYIHKDCNNPDASVLHGQAWGKVYRSKLWENIRFPEGYWFEDTVNRFVIYRKTKSIATIKDIVYHYRDNTKGITNESKTRIRSLDTHWITKRLSEESSMQNLPCTHSFYEQMLEQVIINARRIIGLEEEKMVAALLVAEKGIIDKTIDDSFHSSSLRGHIVEGLLKNCDYKRFRLALLFLSDIL